MGGRNRGAGRRKKARVIMCEQDVLRYGEEAKDRSGGCMEMALCEHGGATKWFGSSTSFLLLRPLDLSLASTMCGFSFL